MMSFIPKVGSLSMILLVGLSACTGLDSTAKSAEADGLSSDQYHAAYEIAAARCRRQTSACSAFSSQDECIQSKLKVSAADARLQRCASDVEESQVQSCVAEIERGQCGTGIARLNACHDVELCPDVSVEGFHL